jgi:hypothetical protein
MSPTQFEASGNFDEWPKNIPGKPTQVAVFGLHHPTKGKTCEILFTAKFPDLETAMYWAAKKEVHAIRKGKWYVASRVLWQHELTPEQAVETARKQIEPQMERALNGSDDVFDVGPLKSIDPSKVQGYYVETEDRDGNDPIDPFFIR